MTQTNLDGRVVLITGASSGVGAAAAESLAAAGAHVTAVARSAQRMREQFAQSSVAVAPGDVRRLQDMEQAVQETVSRHGRLDAVVCNAGVGEYADFMEMSAEAVREIVDTNLIGTIWAIRAALPPMLEAGAGDIVIVSSVVALMDSAGEAVYAATKAAQKSLAGCLDLELRERGIRVTTLCPGGIDTGFAIGRGREVGSPEQATMLGPEAVADAIATVLAQPAGVRTTLWGMSSMTEE